MKSTLCRLLIAGVLAAACAVSRGQTTTAWNSLASSDWGTIGNWTNGLPSTGPQLAIYRGTATLQKSVNLGSPGRESVGMRFTLTAGGSGYTFSGIGGPQGFFVRAGGSANGIINSDDNTQTFNVPVKLLDNAGLAGPGAAMTWNAAAGAMVFNGNNTAPAAPWTVNLNGASALTIDGPFNVSIGTSGPGQVVNTNVGTSSGFIKNGAGSLFLGGTAANTFTGTNFLNAGKITAGKVDALGAGNALVMAGGTLEAGGFSQALGNLDLNGNATLDFGGGTVAVSFDNSAALNWGSFTCNIVNWTTNVDTLRFGTDATGLTPFQLQHITFVGSGLPYAAIDVNGFVTPIPEPHVAVVAATGLFLFAAGRRLNRRNG